MSSSEKVKRFLDIPSPRKHFFSGIKLDLIQHRRSFVWA